jgi:hypothetical protein
MYKENKGSQRGLGSSRSWWPSGRDRVLSFLVAGVFAIAFFVATFGFAGGPGEALRFETRQAAIKAAVSDSESGFQWPGSQTVVMNADNLGRVLIERRWLWMWETRAVVEGTTYDTATLRHGPADVLQACIGLVCAGLLGFIVSKVIARLLRFSRLSG